VLNTTGNQSISVTDSVMPITFPGSVSMAVLCAPGSCPGPGGPPGSRDTNPGPPGAVTGRQPVNQSGAVAPGPRLPKRGSLATAAAGASNNAGAPTIKSPAPSLPQFGGAVITE
jgi:hypothetical protein